MCEGKGNMLLFLFLFFWGGQGCFSDDPGSLSTQMFFELVQGGCQFGLGREAVPYLGNSKEKGFISLRYVLLGQPGGKNMRYFCWKVHKVF